MHGGPCKGARENGVGRKGGAKRLNNQHQWGPIHSLKNCTGAQQLGTAGESLLHAAGLLLVVIAVVLASRLCKPQRLGHRHARPAGRWGTVQHRVSMAMRARGHQQRSGAVSC